MFPLLLQTIISNQMRPRRLRGAWFSRLLRHPARRRSWSILTPGTHTGLPHEKFRSVPRLLPGHGPATPGRRVRELSVRNAKRRRTGLFTLFFVAEHDVADGPQDHHVELDLIADPDMYLMFESGIRGGLNVMRVQTRPLYRTIDQTSQRHISRTGTVIPCTRRARCTVYRWAISVF